MQFSFITSMLARARWEKLSRQSKVKCWLLLQNRNFQTQKDNWRYAPIKKLILQIVFRIEKYFRKHVRQNKNVKSWMLTIGSPNPTVDHPWRNSTFLLKMFNKLKLCVYFCQVCTFSLKKLSFFLLLPLVGFLLLECLPLCTCMRVCISHKINLPS